MKKEISARAIGSIALRFLIAAAACFILYYVFLPPIHWASYGFWFFTFVVLCIFGVALGSFDFRSLVRVEQTKRGTEIKTGDLGRFFRSGHFSRIYACLVVLPLAIMLLGAIISSPVFRAGGYAGVIDVNERDFATDMPETEQISNIALMDTDSARILGTRKLGALSHVVSQYVASEEYTQINYKGRPVKVSNLEYDGFFKWLSNRKSGLPGYVMVDAVANTAEYCELPEGMIYAESAYFGEDLYRALRFAYPTKIFDNISFEVNEEGQVFYIVSCATPRVFPFAAMDISEAIIFDPVTGESELRAVADVPHWVDIVYDGYLACEKYDWYGTLSGGFINSIIGNKGCKQTTDDFGYIMLDDDVWYFTGVTSVTSDASNIGFILSCARTGEYKFYPVIGAEEYSAMGAAQGEVQEKGYVASFPSLVNIAGEPTYIMVLKDQNGLVKLYALVNIEQHGIVATGETQEQAKTAYIKLLAQSGMDISGGDGAQQATVTVAQTVYAQLNGVTYVYITDTAGDVYRVEFNPKNETIVFVGEGDRLVIDYTVEESSGIRAVSTWQPAPTA